MSTTGLVIALLLVILNGFFVAAEFSVIKVRGTRLEELARRGSRSAPIVQRIQSRLDSYLSATQLGVTLASLALGSVGEPAVAALIKPLFRHLGPFLSDAAANVVGIVVAFTLITWFHILFGELAPKWLAIGRPDRIALLVAVPLELFYRTFYPLVWLLNLSARGILIPLGVRPVGESEEALSEEELRLALSHSEEGGNIAESAGEIADRAFHFGRGRVRDVMTPRPDVAYLSTESTLADNLAVVARTNYARYPLCRGDLDDVIGRVHVRDLLPLVQQGYALDLPCPPLESLAHPVLYVPESKPLDDMLEEYQTRRMEMAIVQDEYGVTAGVVTLEDILEELVGEIQQEFAPTPSEVERLPDGSYLVDSTITLARLVREYDIGAEVEDIETIGGFVLSTLSGQPTLGYATELDGWRVEIAEMAVRRIRRVRLTPLPPAETESDSAGSTPLP